jgi:hypothetical protein
MFLSLDNAKNRPQDSNQIQQYFSTEKQPTLWRALPAIEELQTAWEAKCHKRSFAKYHDAIDDGLMKIKKYYSHFNEKPAFIIALSEYLPRLVSGDYSLFVALHPYYKLAYIELAWGGAQEQEAERRAGNQHAKNWQDEAYKILEKTVCSFPLNLRQCSLRHGTDRALLEHAPEDHE